MHLNKLKEDSTDFALLSSNLSHLWGAVQKTKNNPLFFVLKKEDSSPADCSVVNLGFLSNG